MSAAGKMTSDLWLMLWPLVDRQPLVMKKESDMLSSSTFCLSLHMLQIDPHPHQSSSPTASQCKTIAKGSGLTAFGQNLLLIHKFYKVLFLKYFLKPAV